MFSEAQILERAQQLEYSPGIVRQLLRIPYDDKIGLTGFRIRRRLKVVSMSSYAMPISRCRDAMDLLKVTYNDILGIISIGSVTFTT